MSEMSISSDLFTTRVNSTMMSINERFTYLEKKARSAQTSLLTIRANNSAQQQASAKNRRLAMQMEKRLTAMAALRLKKKSIRQRLGVPNNSVTTNVHDRLSLPLRGKPGRGRRGLRRNGGRSLQRSQSIQSLQGGNSQRTTTNVQLLNKERQRARSRSRSRTRAQTPSQRSRANSVSRQQPQRSPSVGRQMQKKNFGRQRRFSTGSFGQQANSGAKRGRRNFSAIRNKRLGDQGNKFGRNQRGARNAQRGRGNFRTVNSQGGVNQQLAKRGRGRNLRGRGGRPGRGGPSGRGGRPGRGGPSGRGGRPGRVGRPGRGGQTKVILPTKEELDKQLEQYMARTKSHLDKEIDTYMKESGVNDY